MKTITCYECGATFESETRDDILKQLYTHYMTEHNAIITGASSAEKKAWMERFERDWEQA